MKRENFKVSGKTLPIPALAEGWKAHRRPGGWIVFEGPKGQQVRGMLVEHKGRLSVAMGGTLWSGGVLQERGHGVEAAGGADSDLTAEFPGKVRKILVQLGEKVEAGQPLVLVEAMKMEFSIKAPAAGTVTKILVRADQQLSPGHRFLEIDTGDED